MVGDVIHGISFVPCLLAILSLGIVWEIIMIFSIIMRRLVVFLVQVGLSMALEKLLRILISLICLCTEVISLGFEIIMGWGELRKSSIVL